MSVSEFKTVLSYDEHVSLLIELGHPDEARMIVTRVREENGLADGQPFVIDSAATAAAGASDITDDIPDIVPADLVMLSVMQSELDFLFGRRPTVVFPSPRPTT